MIPKLIKHGKIANGQYSVTINLQCLSNSEKFTDLEEIIEEIGNDCDDDIDDIYKYESNKLTYRSETLFPLERYVKKKKVLIVFGNPAIHSIKNKMFFFSRAKNLRHGMWAKLERANLIKRVRINNDDRFFARRQEAEERKNLILTGRASEKYCLGLTTFYSFPTPVQGRFRDVQGVEKLFRRILKDVIIPFEAERIYSYPFAKDAILVFVQKSSHDAFKSQCNKRTIFWPIRGKGSSGAYLFKKLSGKC